MPFFLAAARTNFLDPRPPVRPPLSLAPLLWHREFKLARARPSTTTSVGGRGPALNAGARIAKGDLLLFVHADTVVPPGFDVTLRKAFKDDPEILMSAFLFGINRSLLRGKEPFGMAVLEMFTNLRTRSIHLPYGDQASCVQRAFFFLAVYVGTGCARAASVSLLRD